MSMVWRRLKDLFTVPDTFDPDDLRLRRVCNGVLVVMACNGLVSAAFSLAGAGSQGKLTEVRPTYFQLLLISMLIFFLCAGLFVLNRWKRTPKHLVGGLLVGLLILATPFTDVPGFLLYGSSQPAWVIPILLAAIVLPPRSAFVAFALETAVIVILTPAPVLHELRLNYWLLLVLFAITFLAWLGMSVAEHAIRDARNETEKNRAILDGVADGVVVVGVDNKIILTNPAAVELVKDEMFKIPSAGENIEIGGRILALRWSTVQGVGRVAIIRDISRQVEIEHAKDAVLRVVSHEMRTPLAAIMGFTETLAVRSSSDSDIMQRIRVNAQRMMALVDDLLDQAHIEAGVLKMHYESFTPASLAHAIQESLAARAKQKQITLTMIVSEALPKILIGDPYRYQQILANLVDNAIKFTGEGGRVDVLLAPCDNADQWQMTVTDTGVGIPPERLPDIFLPFRRASDYAKRSSQGAGLGLSIAKRIAQLAHGDIQVQSAVGCGSTFTVTLPISGGA